MIHSLADRMKSKDILDYGCGKGSLSQASPTYNVINYDPGISQYSEHPTEAHDLVVCTDVLEHVEPDCIDAVLDDLQRLTKRCLYVIVCTVEAKKTLPDGRNAHLTVRDYRWWMEKFLERFEIRMMENLMLKETPAKCEFVLKPKHEGRDG